MRNRTIVTIRSYHRFGRNGDDNNDAILSTLSEFGPPDSVRRGVIYPSLGFFDHGKAESGGYVTVEADGKRCYVVPELVATWNRLIPELADRVIPGVVAISMQSEFVFEGEIA